MHRFSAATALILAVGLSCPAIAGTYATPEALIIHIYDLNGTEPAPTFEEMTGFPIQNDLSSRLLGLFKAEQTANPNDPSNLDWDPISAGQDGEAADVNIGKVDIDGDTARVVVNFVNGGPVELIYSLVREDGGWKVDDISQNADEYPWTVSKQIQAR